MAKHLLVTHHAPDLDAIGSVWIFKRFEWQNYGDAHVDFVDPGKQIEPTRAEELGVQMHQVTHVDTGLGEFDHHQAERGHEYICATSLVYDHLCKLQPDKKRDKALAAVVQFITDDDHFGEVHWPEPSSLRYCFMLSELLHGFESVDPHNDESQLEFGMRCLDCAYAALKETIEAQEEILQGQEFQLPVGKCLAIVSRNDRVVKQAQKAGFQVVIRKDPKTGEMRIKARPDTDIDLTSLSEEIKKIDQVGSWFNHASGKMLLNGSRKQRQQRPTPLSLAEVMDLMQKIYK